ncbi:FTR1 family protein [Candidatus Bipolaricaulota bacterium]
MRDGSVAGVLGGGLLGIATAVLVGWLLYTGRLRLNLRVFFRAMSVILILVAAGRFAHGIHGLQEATVLLVVIEHVWNINGILNEQSASGQILKGLFGYNGDPSLIEVLGFFGYLFGVTLALARCLGPPRCTPQGAAA